MESLRHASLWAVPLGQFHRGALQGRRSPTSQSPGARETTLYGGLPPLASTASAVILSSFSIPPSQQSPKAQRSGHQETQ